MSLVGYKKHVEDGDLVIVFIGHESMVAVTIKTGDITQTKYGAMRHSDVLGKEFGSKIQTVNQRGYVYILHPSPELWTVNLPHRTQILYFADISMITMQLELKPGSLVVESGTGSGSMSHSLARTIFPTGHLYTFEFHEQRSEMARLEFKKHGLADVVTVEHRDVCEAGFGLELKVDAVFLDLPSPHVAVAHARKIMRPGGRICSFSPCIEQVQRTCQELHSHGFSDVTTMECLLRNYDTRTIGYPVPKLGLDEEGVDEASRFNQNEKVPDDDVHMKEEMSASTTMDDIKANQTGDSNCDSKNNLDEVSSKGTASPRKPEAVPAVAGKGDSKQAAAMEKMKAVEESSAGGSGCPDVKKFKRDDDGRRGGWRKAATGQYAIKCSVPSKETAGHTGYLTFATLYCVPE